MKSFPFFLLLILFCRPCCAQDYSSFSKTMNDLRQLSGISDSTLRKNELDEIWNKLQQAGQIPFVVEDSVAFLYRGIANTVEWIGDFNGWGYDKTFAARSRKIEGTDMWIMKTSFSPEARLDYKIILNGRDWILDPANLHQQWSGVGGGSPNSELRMPRWQEDPIHQKNDGIAHGTVSDDILFTSSVLGYQITYNVYMPAVPKPAELPVVYVTDGYEYMHPKLGNMVTVLDNLIGEKKIMPVIAVFVDHREPINRANNRRMNELAVNEKYLHFFVQELIPEIEKNYPVAKGRDNRAILGNSMGGLNAAYFIFAKPEIFGMAGMQSPAFWTRPRIYSLCESMPDSPTRISITSGVINDASDASRKMKAILEQKTCILTYRETQEGHSWGNFRNLIDDILIDFFGTH